MCVQKVAGVLQDCWGHGALAGQRGTPWSRRQCLCFCVTLPSQDQPLVDARAGHHPRVGAAQEEEVWRRRALCQTMWAWSLQRGGSAGMACRLLRHRQQRQVKLWTMSMHMQRSLAEAKRLCPSFWQIHKDTPRRWQKQPSVPSVHGPGRPAVLSEAQVTLLTGVVAKVTARVELDKIGVAWRPSIRWVRTFLLKLGCHIRVPAGAC